MLNQENIPLQSGEEILPIQGYEGLYSVTSFGRVWSHERECICGRDVIRQCGGVFLRFKLDKDNYFRVCLRNKGHKKDFFVHRLVGVTFIENPLNLPEINHKDTNKQNNYKSNLEWCTQDYNKSHAIINRLYIHKKTSDYYGVYFKFDKRRKKWWVAYIQHNRKRKEIGRYCTEIEAAQAYNNYVLRYNLDKPLNRI